MSMPNDETEGTQAVATAETAPTDQAEKPGRPAKQPKPAKADKDAVAQMPPEGAKPRKATDGLGIGRVVHYVLKGQESDEILHRPGMVTMVGKGGKISLNVFITRADFPKNVHPGAVLMLDNVAYDADCKEGTWHWPESV